MTQAEKDSDFMEIVFHLRKTDNIQVNKHARQGQIMRRVMMKMNRVMLLILSGDESGGGAVSVQVVSRSWP